MEIKETREIEIELGLVRVSVGKYIAVSVLPSKKSHVHNGLILQPEDLDDLIACLQEAKKQITKEE